MLLQREVLWKTYLNPWGNLSTTYVRVSTQIDNYLFTAIIKVAKPTKVTVNKDLGNIWRKLTIKNLFWGLLKTYSPHLMKDRNNEKPSSKVNLGINLLVLLHHSLPRGCQTTIKTIEMVVLEKFPLVYKHWSRWSLTETQQHYDK